MIHPTTGKKLRRLTRQKQDALIEQYMPLARSIAMSAYRRLPNHRFEDILGAAHLGLVDAARRFFPGLKVPFECYARTRISGSIIDAHRVLHKVTYVNEFPPDPIDDGTSFQKHVGDGMLKRAISTVLKTLPEFELRIVQLRYGREMTLREIAAELDVSECHVSQTHRALLKSLGSRMAVAGLTAATTLQ